MLKGKWLLLIALVLGFIISCEYLAIGNPISTLDENIAGGPQDKADKEPEEDDDDDDEVARPKEITSFVFYDAGNDDLNEDITATVNSSTVYAVVDAGTTVTALVPTIAINGDSVTPASGVAQDFTNPVTYTVTADDNSTKNYTVTVSESPDAIDPVIDSVIVTAPAGSWAKESDTITLEFSVTDNESGVSGTPVVTLNSGGADMNCAVAMTTDNGASKIYTATYTVQAGDADGAVNYTITAEDFAGNTDSDTGTTAKTIDTTLPSINLSCSPNNFGKLNDAITFSANVSDGGSGIDPGVDIQIDADPYTLMTDTGGGAWSFNWNVDDSGTGAITVTARCYDNAGNENTDSMSFFVDNTAPGITITLYDSNAGGGMTELNPGDEIYTDFTLSESTSGVDTPSVVFTIAGVDYPATVFGTYPNYTSELFLVPAMTNAGTIYCTVEVSDGAGNSGSSGSQDTGYTYTP